MRPVGPACLPDHELVFNYRSVLRKGGALNIRPRKGQIVHGAIFEVDDRGWEILDLKESVAAGCYARTKVVAIVENGRTVPVTTYVVTPERTESFVAPSEEYVEIVLRGLAFHGQPTHQFERSARDLPAEPQVDGVFVYGTLMQRESRHTAIQRNAPLQIRSARISGRLHETGADYPALVLEGVHPQDSVRGEFVQFADLSAALNTLDEMEAFSGYTSGNNEYERTLVEVDAEDGKRRSCWTYLAGSAMKLHAPIDSGCWRTHSGMKPDLDRVEVLDSEESA